MNYLVEHLDYLKTEKRMLKATINHWVRRVNGEDGEIWALGGEEHDFAVKVVDNRHTELLELDDKITEVYNSLLKIAAWDGLFAEEFNLSYFIDRAEGLGVNVKHQQLGITEGFYYRVGVDNYIKFERGEWMY